MADPSEQQKSSAASVDSGSVAYAVNRVREAIDGLRYGEVRVVVQDGVIVQVERTEKLRIERGKTSA